MKKARVCNPKNRAAFQSSPNCSFLDRNPGVLCWLINRPVSLFSGNSSLLLETAAPPPFGTQVAERVKPYFGAELRPVQSMAPWYNPHVGFRVQGLRLRVQGLGFGFRFRVSLGFRLGV